MDRALPQPYNSTDSIDPTAETVINGAPYVMGQVPSNTQNLGDELAESVAAIRGRLVTAASVYLAAQRDTVGG